MNTATALTTPLSITSSSSSSLTSANSATPSSITMSSSSSLASILTPPLSSSSTRISRRSRTQSPLVSPTTMQSESVLPPLTTATRQLLNEPLIDLQLRVWRAFKVGTGKSFQFSDFKSTSKIIPLTINPAAQHLNNEWKSETLLKGIGRSNTLLFNIYDSFFVFRRI